MTKLRVVGTPIGNIADMSPRVTETLKAADIVLCEDTRHSAPLVKRTGSSARLLSCHAHNETERAADVVAALERKENVALISDAGAPGLSDPGGRIVEAVVAAGFEVEVIPGPSALVAAIMGAGVDVSKFAFLGFLPKSRASIIENAARADLALVIYEAPQRTSETLDDLFQVLGPRRVVVARELTKLHETFHRGVLGSALNPPFVEKGEVVIIVEAGELKREDVDIEMILRDDSLTPKERAKKLAKAKGISTKEAYAMLTRGTGVDEALDYLAKAARALMDAERAAREKKGAPPKARENPVPSDVPGADELMDLLAGETALAAPVEVKAAAQALLTALERMDTLKEALE
jgi:16S rRNA (cytidine1402-2'-O)-methyltransferase